MNTETKTEIATPAAGELTLASMRAARNAAAEGDAAEGASILIWGEPRTGKTLLAGTIAKLPHIKKVYWFDFERGLDTLIYATKPDGSPYFSEEELGKIVPFSISDTPDSPRAAETILKAFTSPTPLTICQEHGTVACKVCPPEAPKQQFHLRGMGHTDAVVIDSGSQLADSVLNMEKKLYTYKNLMKYYFDFTADMRNIMSCIQAAKTHVIMVTHTTEVYYENDNGEQKRLGTFPLVGSGNFSSNVGKYFGYIIYKHIELNKFKQGSNPMYKPKILTGTRTGVSIEAIEGATLVDLLMPAPKSIQPKETSQPVITSAPKPVSTSPLRPMTPMIRS